MRATLFVLVGLLLGIGAAYTTHAQAPAPRLNLVVVCVKCIPEDMPQEGYNTGDILLDQNTGELWFYPALSPGVKPRLLGTLRKLGEPMVRPQGT